MTRDAAAPAEEARDREEVAEQRRYAESYVEYAQRADGRRQWDVGEYKEAFYRFLRTGEPISREPTARSRTSGVSSRRRRTAPAPIWCRRDSAI